MKRQRRLLLAAYKVNGEFTQEDRDNIRRRVYDKLTDDCMITSVSRDGWGIGVLLIFDSYEVEQLSFLKRIRHYLRMLLAAVSSYVGMCTRVIVIILT